MPEIRVKFDTVIVVNPKNWRSFSVRYQRDKALNGLFTRYTNELEWIGDAYDAIQTALGLGACDTIEVLAEWRCSRFDAFTTLFEGQLILADVKTDVNNCVSTATVEDNSCVAQFMRLLKTEVDLNNPFSLDQSVAMTSPVKLITDAFAAYNFVTNTYASLGFEDVFGFEAAEGFAFMVKYLTDDCLAFTSDFFTTTYQAQIVRLDFTVDPTSGEDIILECTDDFTGIKYKYQAEYKTGIGVPAYELVRNNFVTNGLVPTSGTAYIYSNGVSGVDFSVPGGGVNARFDLTFHMPTTITSFTFGSGTATQTEIQAFVSGGEDMFIANDDLFRDQTPTEYGTVAISFAQLYEFLQKTFDLGMSFEEIGGTWTLRIEPSEFFLDTTSTLTIRNIKEATVENDIDQLANSVGIGTSYQKYSLFNPVQNLEDGGANREFFGTRYPTLLTDCESFIDRTLTEDFYHLLGGKMNTVASDTDVLEDQWYLIHCKESGGAKFPIDFRLDVFDIFIDITYRRLVCYNKTTSWINHLFYHAYTLPGIDVTAYDSSILRDTFIRLGVFGGGPPYTFTVTNATMTDVTIAEGDGYTSRKWMFTKDISKADFDLIVNLQTITINTGSNPADDVDTFIDDVIFNAISGSTEFKLRSK